MEQYIPKSILIEEMERRIKYNHERAYIDRSPCMAGRENECKDILSFLNTIEVKEVDLDKEIDEHWDEWTGKYGFHFYDFAKHFFELGMAVSNKAQKEE